MIRFYSRSSEIQENVGALAFPCMSITVPSCIGRCSGRRTVNDITAYIQLASASEEMSALIIQVTKADVLLTGAMPYRASGGGSWLCWHTKKAQLYGCQYGLWEV